MRSLQGMKKDKHYLSHLNKDRKLKKLTDRMEAQQLSTEEHIHLVLCSSIISQQLSTKVAAIIYGRFIQLFDHGVPSPEEILSIPFESLREIGLSNSKANYIRNVCEYFIEEKLDDSHLFHLSDEEVIDKLIAIKGVGRWTIEMLMMFSLGREDVFAVDDLGIQKAMAELYDLDMSDKKHLKKEMLRISEKWKPYRTYACLYLWAWKDT